MFRFINNLKTFMLLAGLMAIFVLVGSYWGQTGMIIALFLGGFMNVVAYFFSDKIALATMRAQPVSPNEAPEIYQMVRELAVKAGLPMPRVYVAPTATPNAFATGRNPQHAVVCLTQGILNTLDRQELRGVIAHELSHIKHYDVLISTIAATIAGAISAFVYLLWFVPVGSSDSRGGNPLVAIAGIILAPIAAGLIQMAISRKREYNADNYAAELVGDGMPLATALEKLHAGNQRRPMQLANPSQANMFIVEPFSGRDLANLFATHPSVEKRVKALIGRERTGRVY
ncbi:MAG: zinc metalloprotease HtpX [Phycisphaerae bacterium]|nr:zinc metalloprotease HtpX [Phycisphaerae bacterium]